MKTSKPAKVGKKIEVMGFDDNKAVAKKVKELLSTQKVKKVKK